MIQTQIETKRARDAPETNIEREGIETQNEAVGVRNKYRIKSVKKGDIQTSWGNRDMVLKNPNVNREERLRQLRDIDRRKDYFKHRRFTLARKKYTKTKGDDGSPNNIASVERTVAVAGGVVHAGGVIRTAVGGTRTAAGRIQTAVKSGVRLGSVKDVGRMAGGIGTAAKNTAAGAVGQAGHSLLRTKIDKTKTSDTGMEAIKQGLTDLRYADNARKAVHNTARAGIKTVRSIKDTPKAVKRDVRKFREKFIRKRRAKQLARRKGKAAGGRLVNVFHRGKGSGGVIAIALAGVSILLIIVLLTSLLAMIISAICSLFSWLMPGKGWSPYEALLKYQLNVQKIQAQIQEEIDGDYVYTPEYRWDGSEITSLKQYGNLTLDVDVNAVIAAAAADRFQYGDDMLKNEDLKKWMEKFYTYEHHIDTGHCPSCDCKREEKELTASDFSASETVYVQSTNSYNVTFKGSCYEHTSSVYTEIKIPLESGCINGSTSASVYGSNWQVVYNISADNYSKVKWDEITIKTTTIYCDKTDHKIYYGEVVNLDAKTGLDSIGFSQENESVFCAIYDVLQNGGV